MSWEEREMGGAEGASWIDLKETAGQGHLYPVAR